MSTIEFELPNRLKLRNDRPGSGANGEVHVLVDFIGHPSSDGGIRTLHGLVDEPDDTLSLKVELFIKKLL